MAVCAASPGTEIRTATARFGALYIENRIEASIASHAVLDALAEHGTGVDAAIVSAFGDPGLAAARELVDIPVVGVSEAAFLMAWTLGRRYARRARRKLGVTCGPPADYACRARCRLACAQMQRADGRRREHLPAGYLRD